MSDPEAPAGAAPHPPLAEVVALIAKWRAEGARCDTFHATMGSGYKVCADDLAAAVSRLPPQPIENTEEKGTRGDRECLPEQPRTASQNEPNPQADELTDLDAWVTQQFLTTTPTRHSGIPSEIRYWDGWAGALYNVRNKIHELQAARLPRPPAPQLEELLEDLRELERLYNTDRVAQFTANQIERIFDKWLHEGAPAPAPAWQPMATCPKDGTPVLIGWLKAGKWTERRAWYVPEFEILHVDEASGNCTYRPAWTDGAVVSFSYEETAEYTPTHWQPLPPPPEHGK